MFEYQIKFLLILADFCNKQFCINNIFQNIGFYFNAGKEYFILFLYPYIIIYVIYYEYNFFIGGIFVY